MQMKLVTRRPLPAYLLGFVCESRTLGNSQELCTEQARMFELSRTQNSTLLLGDYPYPAAAVLGGFGF